MGAWDLEQICWAIWHFVSHTGKQNIETNKICTVTYVSRLGIYQTRECLQFLVSKTPLLQLLSLSLFLLLPPLPATTTSVISTLKQMPEGLPPGGGRALQCSRETQQSRHHHKTKFVWGEEKKQCTEIIILHTVKEEINFMQRTKSCYLCSA